MICFLMLKSLHLPYANYRVIDESLIQLLSLSVKVLLLVEFDSETIRMFSIYEHHFKHSPAHLVVNKLDR